MIKIYHNPRCSKSRQTLQLINDAGSKAEIVEYLKTPPDEKELKSLVQKLGIRAEDLVRKNEDLYKEKYKGKAYSEEEWLKILAENPKLIERPIVVKDSKAVLGRPPENVRALL